MNIQWFDGKNITEGDLLIVKWYDIEDESEWESIKSIRRMSPPLAKTVGWLIDYDEMCIRLAYSVVNQDAGRSIIPLAAVATIEKVQEDELDVV